jgi:hypothetical protein
MMNNDRRCGRRTVQQELKRRKDCRYGLYGVRVALQGHGEDVFAILGSYWDERGKLLLDVCSVPDFKALEARKAGRPLIFTAADLLEETVQECPSEICGVAAADCFLLSDWPIECGCWLP